MIKVDYSSYRRQQMEFASGLIRAAGHALDTGDERSHALTMAAQAALNRSREDQCPDSETEAVMVCAH